MAIWKKKRVSDISREEIAARFRRENLGFVVPGLNLLDTPDDRGKHKHWDR